MASDGLLISCGELRLLLLKWTSIVGTSVRILPRLQSAARRRGMLTLNGPIQNAQVSYSNRTANLHAATSAVTVGGEASEDRQCSKLDASGHLNNIERSLTTLTAVLLAVDFKVQEHLPVFSLCLLQCKKDLSLNIPYLCSEHGDFRTPDDDAGVAETSTEQDTGE